MDAGRRDGRHRRRPQHPRAGGCWSWPLRGHYHVSKTEVFGFGTGILAYTLGMRHAFDADHIAAIDNTTRKLIQDGERPLSVGYFFSLGHSTIVFVLAVLLNFGIRALDGAVKNDNSGLHHWTGIIGTSVSGDVPLPDRTAEPRRPAGRSSGSAGRCARAATTTPSWSASSTAGAS